MVGRRHRAAASLGLAVALVGAASPTGAAPAGIGPFAPPAPFHLREPLPVPFVDVTGSIRAGTDRSGVDAALLPPPTIPELGVAPPDLPSAPTLDAGKAASPAAATDVAAALTRFKDGLSTSGASSESLKQRQANRDAIVAFYQARNNTLLWLDGDHYSSTARAVLSRIERAGEDGLDLRGFSVPVLHGGSSTAELLDGELALSEAVVAYARQAGGARIDPLSIDRLITAKRTIAAVPDILSTVATAADAGAALQDFNPPQPGYAALRGKLAELRRAAPMAHGIPLGPTLKLGMRDIRVPLVRSRFGLDTGAADADDLVYDTEVAAAVADFQRANGLPASGALTSRTVAALSGGNPTRLENELVANMERWRWVPRDLGTDHIMVNVPDYSLELTQGGVVTDRARVVVGKPDHQTPIFSNAVRFIIVNPYWNVPLSIIKKEMLPKLAADPNYFADHGYEVVERNGVPVVRQPPGEDNALGRIKFMFPNEHSVYLHDTNARALFGKDKRAFSHGCVRVDQPFKLASAILGPDRWSEKRIEKLVGGDERTINLSTPLPIHIVYFTAFVDDRGTLKLRDDLYGYSEKVKLALGLRD